MNLVSKNHFETSSYSRMKPWRAALDYGEAPALMRNLSNRMERQAV